MAATILEPRQRTPLTTDSARIGIVGRQATHRAETSMTELTQELSSAVGDAYWSYLLQGDLEEAFDSALLRAAFAETPVLSGPLPVWSI